MTKDEIQMQQMLMTQEHEFGLAILRSRTDIAIALIEAGAKLGLQPNPEVIAEAVDVIMGFDEDDMPVEGMGFGVPVDPTRN